jgi:RNA polymerase sigma-70 factor (ECF subfamily)
MEDFELAGEFLSSGNERAFRMLYTKYTPGVYRFATRLTGGNSFLADELVQQMWIIAIDRLGSFRWESSLRTWLIGIVVNNYRTEIRKQNRNETLEQHEVSQHVHDGTLQIDLQAAFDSLSPRCRQVFLLHDLEGWPHREIATMLGIDEGTSKSQLHHARKKLQKFLND